MHVFTDDGNGVQDPLLMRRALEYARGLGITLAQHCEVASLTKGAVMHEGQMIDEASRKIAEAVVARGEAAGMVAQVGA